MINTTLLTMRGTQSVLVLAESEKDRDNYSLNRQSPRWRPHNQDCVCILWSFRRNARQKPQKMKNRAVKYLRTHPTGLMLSPWSQVRVGSGH